MVRDGREGAGFLDEAMNVFVQFKFSLSGLPRNMSLTSAW